MGLNYRGDPQTPDAETWRQLIRDFPFLDGQQIKVTLTATTNPQLFQHFLNRAYRGGLLMCSGLATGVAVLDPAGVVDPTKFFAVQMTAATANTATIWLF